MPPKVSVIIPVYNIEKYITQCLVSVTAQTLRDIEIIVVDDGSTDSSYEICARFAAHDPRIKLIHKQNGGLASARMAGAGCAEGAYVINIDGDDYIEGSMLEKMYVSASNEACDMVICNYLEERDGKSIGRKYDFEGLYTGERLKKLIFPYVVSGVDGPCVRPNVWTKMIRRDLYGKNLCYYRASVDMGEDVLITVPNILTSERILFLPDCFYHYRITKDQMTAKYKDSYYQSEQIVLQTLQQIGNDIDYDLTPQIRRRYINMAWWQLHLVCAAARDKEKCKQAIRKWTSSLYVQGPCEKSWSRREKTIRFLLKHKLSGLIYRMCK